MNDGRPPPSSRFLVAADRYITYIHKRVRAAHALSRSSPRLNIDNPRRPVRICLRPNIIIFRLQPAP